MQWIKGIPTAEQVAEHEKNYPARERNPLLCKVSISRLVPGNSMRPDFVEERVKVDDADSCGRWLINDPTSHFGPIASLAHLRVLNGEILIGNGFSFWQPLTDMRWAARCSYLPVTVQGLPLDYVLQEPA